MRVKTIVFVIIIIALGLIYKQQIKEIKDDGSAKVSLVRLKTIKKELTYFVGSYDRFPNDGDEVRGFSYADSIVWIDTNKLGYTFLDTKCLEIELDSVEKNIIFIPTNIKQCQALHSLLIAQNFLKEQNGKPISKAVKIEYSKDFKYERNYENIK